tara:strand:+ start:52 stop:522 length:471 start_codon:yes stop_codon:yes gene_type:complete
MTKKIVPPHVREARIEYFEANLAVLDPMQAVLHCINRLAEWEDIYNELRTDLCPNLTYEEVLGALLVSRNAIQEQQDNEDGLIIMSRDNTKLYYSLREASAKLGISEGQISSRIKTGEIKAFKLGSRILIPREAVENIVLEPYPIKGEKESKNEDH